MSIYFHLFNEYMRSCKYQEHQEPGRCGFRDIIDTLEKFIRV